MRYCNMDIITSNNVVKHRANSVLKQWKTKIRYTIHLLKYPRWFRLRTSINTCVFEAILTAKHGFARAYIHTRAKFSTKSHKKNTIILIICHF